MSVTIFLFILFWAIGFLGGGLLFFFLIAKFIGRTRNIPFLFYAGTNPDFAYDWFKMYGAAWHIIEGDPPRDYASRFPKKEWEGPFTFRVPKLGNKTITVFGKRGYSEKSRADHVSIIKSRRK